MKVLIIGGLGNLGSRITDYLLGKVEKIIVSTRKRNLKNYFSNKSVNFIKIYWSQKFIDNLVKDLDVIIFAAGFNAKDSVLKKKDAFDFSKYSMNLITKALSKYPIKTFIFISTAHVYSSRLCGKINEDTKTKNNHPYAKSKLISENILLKNIDIKKTNLKIIRLSNAVGYSLFKDNKVWNLFVNNVVRQSITKKRVLINSSSLTRRNFIAISEVCRFILYILENQNYLRKRKILNLGYNKSYSLKEMTTKIQRLSKNYNIKFDINYKNNINTKENYKLDYNSKYIAHSKYKVKNRLNYEIDIMIKKTNQWYN
tara:strand:- start:572 stop:1510 length:939 start_codon:yes stop_codon:yes gene_type:complete